MSNILVLAVSATLGAALRHYVTLWSVARFGSGFPVGTVLVNVLGSFILGFFLTIAAMRADLSPSTRLFVATGFCGSLTTFSTFSYETVTLMEGGNVALAVTYALGSVTVALLCVFLGAAIARALFS